MFIKVFDVDTAKTKKIDSSKFDSKKHFHRNTQKEFTKEDIESFKDTPTKTEATKVIKGR